MEITYTGIHICIQNEVYLRAVIDEYIEESPDHALLLRYKDNTFSQIVIDHAVAGICTIGAPAEKVICVGTNGLVTVATLPGLENEIMDSSDQGPSSLVLVRFTRKVGSHVYACGMARFVYKRESSGLWIRVDDGVFVPREQRNRAVGFHSLDGFSENEIYAVGQYGEIWTLDLRGWHQEDSPANIPLTCVTCAPDGNVYVAGMKGVLIRGSKGGWSFIDHGETTEDFWGSCWFNNKMFFSNYEGIFMLNGDRLFRVKMELQREVTTAYLDAKNGVLWSVGHKHLVYSLDGNNWTEVQRPF